MYDTPRHRINHLLEVVDLACKFQLVCRFSNKSVWFLEKPESLRDQGPMGSLYVNLQGWCNVRKPIEIIQEIQTLRTAESVIRSS